MLYGKNGIVISQFEIFVYNGYVFSGFRRRIEMKVDKSIEILMIIGVILHGLSFIVYLICIFAQQSIYPASINITELIIPADFIVLCIILMLYVIFMLAIFTSNTDSRRLLCIVMLIVYAIVRVLSPYISMLSNVILSRRGAEYIAAAGTLTSTVNLIISPLTIVASILVIVAVGRYGISSVK